MEEKAKPASAMQDLPVETREFLSRLRKEDLAMLEEGVRFLTAVRTVGAFVKWLLIGILGIVVGTVMFYDSVMKILGWIAR